MTTEEEVKRFGVRPGFQLVTYREVALPVFKCRLRCLILEEKQLPPVQEFVLRAVDQGLQRVADVAGLLGVRSDVVQHAAVELMSSDDLRLVGASSPTESATLRLTAKGQETVREAQKTVAEEYVLPVVLDGLTRDVTIEPRTRYLKPSAVRDAGLLEVAPIPKRRPQLDDFPFEKVAQAVRQRRGLGGNLLAVLGIEWRERFFRDGVVALVYRAVDSGDVTVAFVVDGRESPVHESAFASPNNSDFAALTRELEPAENELPDNLVKAADSAGESQSLVLARTSVEVQLAELEAQTAEAPEGPSTAPEELRRQRDELRARVAELEAGLRKYTVRWLEVHEHQPLLARALDEAHERLMIVSPWIRADVVDAAFLRKLERAAQRGANIYIGYGLDAEQREFERDKRAREALERLARDDAGIRLVRFGDTHAKVLVCDDSFAVVTSFNWLSFRGDGRRSFRDERGTLVTDPKLVEEQFEFYRPRFDMGAA